MSGQRERNLGQPRRPAAKTGIMPGDVDEAVTPGGNERTARADPPPCHAAETALSALPQETALSTLPQRIGGTLHPATPAAATRPHVGPELLRRVIDGLKEL
jgi:hypothetical protein